MGTAFDTDYIVVANEFFGIGKLPRKLVVEVGAVGNEYNGWTFEILAFP